MSIGTARNLEDLIDELEMARQRRLERRRGFETQWWENIAFIAGDHYSKYSADRGLLLEPKRDPDSVRLVINHARLVYRTDMARLLKHKPILEAVATDEDPKDIGASKVAMRVLDSAEWKFKLAQKKKRAVAWQVATGLGAIYVGYDPNNDREGNLEIVIDPNTNEPIFSEERKRILEEAIKDGQFPGLDALKIERYAMGDLEFKVYSPFQLLPDETAADFDEIEDLITMDVLDVDVARQMWPGKADDLKSEAVYMNTMTARAMARSDLNPYQDNVDLDNALTLNTWWLLPGKYPRNPFLKNGFMVRWACGGVHLEHSKQFPFSDGRMPFAFFKNLDSHMSIWPDTSLSDVRQINLELDRTVSALIENRNYMANPMWAVPTQANIKGQIKMKPGGVIRYNDRPNARAPEPIPGTPMPAQVENIAVALRDQILEISGQSEPSRGRVPTGVRSGVAVSFLLEEDESKIGLIAENVDGATAYMGSLALSRFGQFYITERLIRLYKPGGDLDVFRFKGSDLRGITDVRAVAGSALPRSKAARQQFVLELAQMGIEKDPKRIRDMLELGMGEPDDTDLAWAQADRENNAMALFAVRQKKEGGLQERTTLSAPLAAQGEVMGQPNEGAVAIPVKMWHNHQAHLIRHYRFMSTQEFEDLQKTHPDVVRLFDEHTGMHEQVLQQQRQQEMQMLMAAKGAPAPEGAAAPAPQGRPDVMANEGDLEVAANS